MAKNMRSKFSSFISERVWQYVDNLHNTKSSVFWLFIELVSRQWMNVFSVLELVQSQWNMDQLLFVWHLAIHIYLAFPRISEYFTPQTLASQSDVTGNSSLEWSRPLSVIPHSHYVMNHDQLSGSYWITFHKKWMGFLRDLKDFEILCGDVIVNGIESVIESIS